MWGLLHQQSRQGEETFAGCKVKSVQPLKCSLEQQKEEEEEEEEEEDVFHLGTYYFLTEQPFTFIDIENHKKK
jgi:hypothetical protein